MRSGPSHPKTLGNFSGVVRLIRQVSMAAAQVAHAGSPAQLKEARKLLSETRRGLYGILAETEEEEEDA